MNRIKRAFSFLLLCMAVISFCVPAYADEEGQTQTLRVGHMDYHGFIDRQEDGTYSGYGVEYLNEISKYTGFRYEYVFGRWTDLLRMLKNKEIDIICTAQKTPEREAQYDFSAYPIGYTQGLLYANEDNSALCYEDYGAFDGISVGALTGSAMTEIFAGYAAQHGFTYSLRQYGTEEALLDALSRGQIDAMCSEHLANHTGLSLLAGFGADAYYIISYKGSPYLEKINFALQEIKTDVDFEATLFHRYYDNSTAATTVPFTLEESSYIASAGIITVGLMDGRSPLSYGDQNGGAAGMLPDLMDMISARSGLRFAYRFLEQGQSGYDFLTSSGGELVAGVAASAFSTPNPALIQSDALQQASVVFVGRGGAPFRVDAELTVALPAAFINGAQVVSARYPNFNYYYGADNQDCLKAIRDGRADVMLQNLYIIRECLQSPLYEGLEIFPAFSFQEDEKVVALPENAVLISIINKTLASLSDEQKSDVVISHTIAKAYHASIGEILYKYRLPLGGVALLLAVVIGMLIAFSAARQRDFRAIEAVNGKLAQANAQLKDAVVQADRANTAKSQFLSRMSHEIRTPMNAIVGLTEIAKQHVSQPRKMDDCLDKIAVSSRVLLGIINDVLDMSAIESNKLRISNEEFDLKQLLGGVSAIYYPQCQSKGVHFDMAIDVEDEILRGDSLRVSQILLNFVSNAYKFTPKGGDIRILVRETAKRDGKAFLRFIISDTGCGMTEDMKARLFRPFEQETSATARAHGGSGLGLSIAKNLVDMMSGAVTVESQKNKGTTFTVELPFEIVDKGEAADGETVRALHILAVDDDAVAREYTQTVLRRMGVSFDIAGSGEGALRMIREASQGGRPYDVCLIDWKMPDMDGVEVTRRIRQSETKRTILIIVSAFDLNAVQEEAKAAGANHFVSKPLFQSTVFNVLTQLTKGKLAKTESSRPGTYDFTGHRVLLAEDQELNAQIAAELLGLAHMASDRAPDGKAAVEMFRSSQAGTYDAILMDVQMPEMDGYEAAAAIRALDRPDAKSIPIYAMTANAFTEDVSAALSAGMNGHIAKPIDTKILYGTLHRVIEEQREEKENDQAKA